jgi:methionyl-tRNA formyltransferase
MKIVFMGTPTFAVPTLEYLGRSRHEVGYVFTQPDKAKDRGKKIQFSPVKEKAIDLNIPVVQPEKIRGDYQILNLLNKYKPDLIVVAAYGQILPKEILDIPRLGCINIHGSLLPRYRGAAPIQRAIMDGELKTGITLMKMDEGLDTGDIIAIKDTEIDRKSCSILNEELSVIGAKLLIDNLDDIENETIISTKQDTAMATYAHMLFKKDGLIDFRKDPKLIECQVRGLNPSPGTYSMYNGEILKIFHVERTNEENNKDAGTITGISRQGLEVSAGGSTLLITEIQLPNKRRMTVEDFIKGHHIELFSKLG